MSTTKNRSAGCRNLLDQSIRAHMPRFGSMAYYQYLELISVVRSQSNMLAPRNVQGTSQQRTVNRIVYALSKMAAYWNQWQRSIYSWLPDLSSSATNQYYSLIDHLFVQYEIPQFLKSSWLQNRHSTRLLIALGKGQSIRKCQMPIPFTKSMAKHFMSAPDDLTVPQAARWAQVRSFDGSPSLARFITQTRLKTFGPQEEFWAEFLRFVVTNEHGRIEAKTKTTFSLSELKEMIAFCHGIKFGRAVEMLGYNTFDDAPLQPNFSVKGRSVRWLRKRMANWRTEIELPARTPMRFPKPVDFSFPKCETIEAFRGIDEGLLWTIDQIDSAAMLRAEGGIMQHCVAAYANRCRGGNTTIWSMKSDDGAVKKHVLTIELWANSRCIGQVKGKRNSSPSPIATQVLKRWIAQESLKWHR